MGMALNFLGQLKEAEAAQRESVAIWKKLLAVQPGGGFEATNPPGGHFTNLYLAGGVRAENLCNSLAELGHVFYTQADYAQMEIWLFT